MERTNVWQISGFAVNIGSHHLTHPLWLHASAAKYFRGTSRPPAHRLEISANMRREGKGSQLVLVSLALLGAEDTCRETPGEARCWIIHALVFDSTVHRGMDTSVYCGKVGEDTFSLSDFRFFLLNFIWSARLMHCWLWILGAFQYDHQHEYVTALAYVIYFPVSSFSIKCYLNACCR